MSDFLWVEQYRPQTIDECILPTDIKETFQSFVDRGEISNFFSTPNLRAKYSADKIVIGCSHSAIKRRIG